MLHERIKMQVLRAHSIDKAIFSESRKPHPLGAGGMSIDMAYDNALIRLNAGGYDTATEFQLYTEGVLKSLSKFTDTCRGANCVSIYKESKIKALLEKIKEWFKKAWNFLKNKVIQLKNWIKRLFTKKGKKAKTTPPNAKPTENAESAINIINESVVPPKGHESSTHTNAAANIIAETVGQGIILGLKEIAKEIFSKNNLKYGGSDIKSMALAVVESAHRHNGSTPELSVLSTDFWDICRGTEYESDAVAAIAVAYICITGAYPYIPSKVLDYLDSKTTKSGSKFDTSATFKGTSVSGGSIANNIAQLYMDTLSHVKTMYTELEHTNITDSANKIRAIKNADVLVTAVSDILGAFDTFGEIEGDEVKAVRRLSATVIESTKAFDGLIADPKSILADIPLSEFMSKIDYYTKQLDIFNLFNLHDSVGDIDALMSELSTHNKSDGSSLNTDELTSIYKLMIDCINPVIKATNSLGVATASMFVSLSEVEEEMVGFYGMHVAPDSVPVTAIAKAIAADAEMSSRLLKRLGFVK